MVISNKNRKHTSVFVKSPSYFCTSDVDVTFEFQMLAALNHKVDHREYCYTLKWESWLTLGLNAAKSTDYIEKYFIRKLCRIKFLTKNSMEAFLLSTHGVELGGSKDLLVLKFYNVLQWESGLNLGMNTAKSTDYIKKCTVRNLQRNRFPTKNSVEVYFYVAQEGS